MKVWLCGAQFRLRKSIRRTQIRTLKVCVTSVPRPPYKGNISTPAGVAPLPYFVKELRRKILHGRANKIFRALDNDVSLKSNDARSGLPPRALITSLPAEPRSAGYFPRRHLGGVPLTHTVHSPDGNIRMKSKEEPRPRARSVLLVRKRSGTRL